MILWLYLKCCHGYTLVLLLDNQKSMVVNTCNK
nr:MAG TPA: conotoxin [Caudoviricetes sp.]